MKHNLTVQIGNINDFPSVFDSMQQQFPSEELKTFEEFIALLNKHDYNFYNILNRDEKVGYFLSYFDKENNTNWIDYIAIKKEFQSLGYGTKLFNVLKETFPNTEGFFFEVEKEDKANPNTIRRANFYKKIGAVKLNFIYFFPTKDNYLEMDLYFLPSKTQTMKKETVLNSIKNLFEYVHFNIIHVNNVYDEITKLNTKKTKT